MQNWKKNAGFFIGGQFLSMFGSMLVQHAITWHITLQTKSGLIMTLFTCAAMLPMVIVSPFAGVWADRYNRKRLIMLSDGFIALAMLGLAGLFWPVLSAAYTVFVQETAAPEVLGRVFSVIQIIMAGSVPIAILFFSPLADAVRVETILLITSPLLALVGLVYGLRERRARE